MKTVTIQHNSHFSARTVSEMLIQDTVNDPEVTSRMEEVCPTTPVDCSIRDLTFRPIDNECNNLLNPNFGNPNTAQIRLAPAFYEHSKWIHN